VGGEKQRESKEDKKRGKKEKTVYDAGPVSTSILRRWRDNQYFLTWPPKGKKWKT